MYYFAFDIKPKSLVIIMLIGMFSGLMSFLFLTLVNHLVGLLIAGKYTAFSQYYGSLFLIAIAFLIFSRKMLSSLMIKLSQQIFWNLRKEIINIVLSADPDVMKEQKSRIQSALVYDVNTLTQASLNLIQFTTSAVVMTACLTYMSIKSVALFAVTLLIAFAGVALYLYNTKNNNKRFLITRELEVKFIYYFNSILSGFKEIKMDVRKGQDIYSDKIGPIAQKAYQNNVRAYTVFLNNQMVGQVLFYSLVASILIFFSVNLNIDINTTVGFIFILLYLLGSIETIMALLPSLIQASVSAKRIKQLKEELITNTSSQSISTIDKYEFRVLSVCELFFKYTSDKIADTFSIGPVSLEINKQDIIFIYGGNGSGKTTFIHALLGLNNPDSGLFKLNHKILSSTREEAYKSLFAVVFNDFFLFDELYGNKTFNRKHAEEYLILFELAYKVTITENGFSFTDLSTGQRKRLALIAALLEEKPIIVLDEWAADQDPYFRKKFYEEIIFTLKRKKFTIIAITHDDAYYRVADKLYKMEEGQLIDECHLIAEFK